MWRMASATPDLRLPSQPQSITAPWPVPNYTAWWQRHMGVNNLPRVAARQCTGRELNRRPIDRESNAQPLRYRATQIGSWAFRLPSQSGSCHVSHRYSRWSDWWPHDPIDWWCRRMWTSCDSEDLSSRSAATELMSAMISDYRRYRSIPIIISVDSR